MKQRKIVSMIGALVVIISAVALITGCPQANGSKDKKENTAINNSGNNSGSNTGGNTGNNNTSTKNIIEFDSASIKCQNTNSFPYTDVTTGDQIHEKDKLMFEAIVPTNKVVENWYINNVKKKYETNARMSYRVKASDIIGGKIKISVIFKDAVKGNIEFDSASIKCQNTNSFPYTDVTTGDQIQEKDKLMFEAILPTGKVVENWYINDVKQEYKTDSTMFYTVKTSDIVSAKLKISVIFK